MLKNGRNEISYAKVVEVDDFDTGTKSKQKLSPLKEDVGVVSEETLSAHDLGKVEDLPDPEIPLHTVERDSDPLLIMESVG
jgi:hypothetical protein